MSFDKGTIHCLLLPNIHPRCSHTLCPQLATFNPAWPHWTQDEQTMKQSHPPTNYSFQSNVRSLRPVLTVEQLLRLGVALPVGGFCCTVNGAAILAAVWPDAGGAGLWLSLAQDGGPGGAIAVADTWLYPAGCWGSSNWEQPAWRKQRLQSVKKRWIKYKSAMMEEKISTAFISTNRGINVTYKDCVTWLNKVNTDRSRGRWWCLQVLERAGRGPPAPPWVWWRGSLPALRSRLFLQKWRSCSCGEAWTGTPSAPRRKLSTSPQCRCRIGGRRRAEWAQSTFEEHMNSGLRFDLCSLRRQCLPEDVVDAHDALRLRVAAVINHSSLGFYPDVASVLGQHAVLTAHCLTLGTHCRDGREEDRFMLWAVVFVATCLWLVRRFTAHFEHRTAHIHTRSCSLKTETK